MTIKDVLEVKDSRIIQQLLHQIPYIANNSDDGVDVDFRVLERVLCRLKENELAISFIMSDSDQYEMILLGLGKWRLPDVNGRLKLYRQIGHKVYCDSLYECVAKAVICLHKFIKTQNVNMRQNE